MRRVLIAAAAAAVLSCAACSGSTDSSASCQEARDSFDAHVMAAIEARETARRLGGDNHLPVTLARLRARNPGLAQQYETALEVWRGEARVGIAVVQGNQDCFSVEERAQADVLAGEYE